MNEFQQAVTLRVKATNFQYDLIPKYNVKSCDCCGSNEFNTYSQWDRYCLPVRNVCCSECGLIYITPRMTNNDYNTFYEQWYRKLVNAYSGKEEDNDHLEMIRVAQSQEILKFVAQHTNYNIETMLDIGGGTGVFAKMFCGVNDQCSGYVIDPCKDELRSATNKGLTISWCSFQDYKSSNERFDFISMLRTIEHLQSIKTSLKKVRDLLVDGGVFVFDIINHDWLINMTNSRQLSTKLDHIYQLNNSIVKRYLVDAKFTILDQTNPSERVIKYVCN